MTEFTNESSDENSALRKRIAELEGIVSELQKPPIRYEDRWLPRLTPILTILGGIQALFIAAGVAFGLIGFNNILSVKDELDKIKELTHSAEEINAQAKIEYKAQLDSLKVAQHISGEIVESAKSTKRHIDLTKQSIDNTYANVEKELRNLKNRISKVDTNIVSLAKVFSSAAVRGQASGFLNASQIEFLYYLSTILHETSGLPVDNDGLHYYNLAVSLMSVGKYEMAIEAFNESLRRQPKLSENKKAQIRQYITFCQNKIEERQKLLSKETDPVVDSNKLFVSILQALKDVGIFEQGQIDEIFKKSALEKK